jgi:hypothetical protein
MICEVMKFTRKKAARAGNQNRTTPAQVPGAQTQQKHKKHEKKACTAAKQ